MSPGATRWGTCRTSIAIVSASASRSRRIAHTRSAGETCRRAPELRARALILERQHAAARPHAALAHVLGERGHGQRQRDLRLGYVGARAVAAQQQPLAHELVDRHAQRRAATRRAARPAAARAGSPPRPRGRRRARAARRERAPASTLLRFGLHHLPPLSPRCPLQSGRQATPGSQIGQYQS